MKIVFISQHYPKARIRQIGQRMIKRGHEVHVVCATSEPADSHTTEPSGLQVHWLAVPYSQKMSFSERLSSFARFALVAGPKARRLRADLIYATSTPLTVILPAIVASAFRQSPLVFEVRDLWPDAPIAMGALKSPIMRRIAFGLEKLAYRSAELIVPLSEDMGSTVRKKGVAADKILVIPNASDLDVFRGHEEAGQAWRAARPWLQDRPMVSYCGTIGYVNNVGFLADVAAEMLNIDPDIRFVIVGSGNDENNVRRKARDLGVLDENFFMIPQVKKAEVVGIVAASDATASTVANIPILSANSANKVFDSFAAMKPVIINHGGWLARVLKRSGAGLVVSGTDTKQAAQDIQCLMRSERLADNAAAAAYLGETEFNRDRLTAVLIDRLEAVARP